MLGTFLKGATAAGGIELVGYTTHTVKGSNINNISLTGLIGGIASQPAEDDFVLAFYACGLNGASVSPLNFSTGGYTTVANLFANDTIDAALLVGYKFMSSTPDTSVVFSASGTGYTSGEDPRCGIVYVFRGVNKTTPMDVAATTDTRIDTVLANPPSITPVTSGALILACGAGGHRRGVATYSSSDLDNFISVGEDDFNDCTIGAGQKKWTGGSFNPATFSFSAANDVTYAACAATLALRPK
jgi:hypothetical protein